MSSFTRKGIKQSSTFLREGGNLAGTTTTPAFTQFVNTTSTDGLFWNLGNNWSMNVNTAGTELKFNSGQDTVFTLDEYGVKDFSLKIMGFRAHSSLPELDATAYENGTMIAYDGDVYILKNEEGGGAD